MILTKRPDLMHDFYKDVVKAPIPNLWLGVTAENQETFDERILILCQIPAVKRFVNMEPLLGPVDLSVILDCAQTGYEGFLGGLDWVIVGGETGPSSRPTHPSWVRTIRDQCQVAKVPFFF